MPFTQIQRMTALRECTLAELVVHVQQRKIEWLQQGGWKQTCQTEGSRWMWTKAIGDKMYVVSQEAAEEMTLRWEEEAMEAGG